MLLALFLSVSLTGLVSAADEDDALRFLDFVTAPMPAADEKAWWDIGGSQHGIFAKRYNIAFCGYAAAALALRPGVEVRRPAVVRILDNCIARMLRRDVWAYSQSKSYWGLKPWSPDPCFRENVMYTGHLLQLTALYEWFSGDDKYWKTGFDFVWDAKKTVHYDVRKLIDVTVGQMRENAFHGVTCEPGLLFFACNNHPHYALRLFSKLGHGSWQTEADAWEGWALEHFLKPLFGGGAVKLVYHAKSGLFYPRGQSALDGWTALWYEPWAKDRATALALWKQAAAKIDWQNLEAGADAPGGESCCNPRPVSAPVTAVFLAAAARACDDAATAERLERIVDARYLVRRSGLYSLDLNREWRIGATAQRIIALAEANGSRFRSLNER